MTKKIGFPTKTSSTSGTMLIVTAESLLRDHAWNFIARCELARSAMNDANLVLQQGPLHMHDFSLGRLAWAVGTQAISLGRAFETWLHPDPPDASERLAHIELFQDLEEAVQSIQAEMEGKQQLW